MSWWQEHPYGRRTVKVLAGIVIVLAVLLGAAVAAIASPWFREHLGGWISQKSGRSVSLGGDVHIEWGNEPRVVFNQVKVANAAWASAPYFFQADRIEFSLRPWELLRGRLVIPELILEAPQLSLEKDAKGDANWDFSENPQSTAVKAAAPKKRAQMPLIGHLRIANGKLEFHDAEKKINTVTDVSTATGQSGAEEPIALKGKGDYQGKPFFIGFQGDSVLELRETKEPYHLSLKLRVGDTTADAEGSVEDPFELQSLDIHLKLAGANTADLFPLTGIALPPSPPYAVEGHLQSDRKVWQFSDFAGKLGDSDLHGTIIWHTDRKPPYLEGNFVSQSLNMKDLAGFVGAEKQPDDNTKVIPDENINVSRLEAMDADVIFKGTKVMTPQLLDDFLMKVHLKGGVLTLEPVSFGIAKGKISANVTIDGTKKPPFTKADVTFSRLSLQQLFEPLVKKYGDKNVSSGLLGGKAKLEGGGKSLRGMLAASNGEIGVGMEGGSLSHELLELAGLDIFRAAGLVLSGDNPVPIRCLVGDFGVSDGIMRTQEMLIDTDVSTIRGEGQVNLKSEAIDLRLTVHPKEASPLSARTPILVGGTLKHPSVGIDAAAAAARGGLAVALGALLTPVGSLLAFIEPGLGEKSDCAEFLHEVDQKTGGSIPKGAAPAPPGRK